MANKLIKTRHNDANNNEDTNTATNNGRDSSLSAQLHSPDGDTMLKWLTLEIFRFNILQ